MYQLKVNESKLEYFFDSINWLQIGSVQNFSVHIIGEFSSFLSLVASNNAFLIKFVDKLPGGTLNVVVGTLSYTKLVFCQR